MTSNLPAEALGRPRTTLAIASIAIAVAAADTYVVVLALADMMSGVGVGIQNLQQAAPIISGFLLGYVAVLPLVGRVADLTDRRQVLLACLGIFIVGSAVTALASSLGVLVAGRVIQGVGGGGLVPATLALVADRWPAERRGLPLGIVGGVQEAGAVLGPLLGAAILAVADWRAIFWLNVAAGALLLLALLVANGGATRRPSPALLALSVLGAIAWWWTLAPPLSLRRHLTAGLLFIPYVPVPAMTPIATVAVLSLAARLALTRRSWWPPLSKADLPGALLFGISLGCVIVTFASAEPERAAVGPLGYLLLPVAAVAAAGAWWRQRTAHVPLVPRGTMRGRAPWALVTSFCVGAALVAVVVDVPLFANLTQDAGHVAAALVLVRFLVAVPFGAIVGGWATRHVGDGTVAGAGLLLAAGALLSMARWDANALAGLASTISLVAVGFGVGLAIAPVNNAALADAPDWAHGTAASLVIVARMVGMVVGLALLTSVGLHRYYLAVRALPADQRADPNALLGAALVQVHTVFVGAAVVAAIGGVVSFALLGLRRRGAITRGDEN